MQRLVLSLILVFALPIAAYAQSDDRGFLQGLLEDALSAEGRTIQIEGFRGALSSRATIDRITAADRDGIWLEARDIALTWNRAALLRGRIDAETLSAGEITLTRAPRSEPSLPSPEAASPFTLPDLPVAVALGSLQIDAARIGAAILGEDAVFSVSGSASLADGDGAARLDVERLDRAATLLFDGGFDNATRALRLALDYREPAGGLASDAMGLAPATPLTLVVAGDGTAADFDGTLGFTTDGIERLAGTMRLAADDADEVIFTADMGGDLAPLLAPDYRGFLGPEITLDVDGTIHADGALDLRRATLDAAALTLGGTARIGPDGWPERFDVNGVIEASDQTPVLLPLPGTPTRLTAARISAGYDVAQGTGWQASVTLDDLDQVDFSLGSARLDGRGQIAPQAQSVTGILTARAAAIRFADAALAEAVGDAIDAAFSFDWDSATARLRLSDLAMGGADYTLTGDLTVSDAPAGLGATLAPDLALRADRLDRFAGLAQMPIAGAASLSIRGTAEPLRGAFDLSLGGETRDLRLGIEALDPLIAGTGTLTLAARRDATGLHVEPLALQTPLVRIDTTASLGSDTGNAAFAAELRDLAVLVPGLGGAARVEGTATRPSADAWTVAVTASGPVGSTADIAGTVQADGSAAALVATGQLPLTLANPFMAPQTATGTLTFDLGLNGPFAPGSVSGTVSTQGARLALPAAGMAIEDIRAQIQLANQRADVAMTAGLNDNGGTLQVTGPIALVAPFATDLTVTLRDGRVGDGVLYDAALEATLGVAGPLTAGPAISGTVDLSEAELRIPQVGPSFTLLDGLSHQSAPAGVARTLEFAGMSLTAEPPQTRSGGGLPIDIAINAPGRIFVRGRGLDAEFGGAIRIAGTSADLTPSGGLELIRGRLDLLGQRLTLTQATVGLRGSFDPVLSILAEAEIDDTTVMIALDGVASDPDLSVTASPELPEDEALALLLFGRTVTQLSPLQAVRLAAAIRTLTGRGNGFSETLRSGLGVDDFDISTDETGQTQARVGAYLSENVYTDVTVGSGDSEVTLNLDLTDSVTVRGRVDSGGDSGFGIFFERDY